ncbi:MAG: HNH endonuclease [Ignavibacteriales bacterium]
MAKYHVLLDPEKDTILSLDRLNEPPFVGVHWSSQSSGIDIPDGIATELEKALTNLSGTNPLYDLETQKDTYINLKKTEREAVVQSRIGQGKFRSRLIKHWKGCAVIGCQEEELLKASHIKPWRESNNAERLDVYNGLLLTPNLDSAFESGLISFKDDGKIMISKSLSKVEAAKLAIHPKMKISRLQKSHTKYLNYHRKNIFLSPKIEILKSMN